jgi:hypothetical protein
LTYLTPDGWTGILNTLRDSWFLRIVGGCLISMAHPREEASMPPPQKRKISAREVVSDIKAGMRHSQLKAKYGLSNDSLESVLRKLVSAGALTEKDLAETRVEGTMSAEDTSTAAIVSCPGCRSPLPEGTTECPLCGVVFEKFAARARDEGRRLLHISEDESSSGRPRLYVSVALLACALAVIAFMLWPRGKTQEDSVAGRKTDIAQTKTSKKKDVGSERQKKQGLYMSKAEDRPADRDDRVVEFQYSDEGFPLGSSVSQGFALHLFETPSSSQGFKKFPPETDAKRYYDEFSIAGATYLVITEESDPPNWYLDANQNGDLTDDPGPFTGEQPGLSPNHYTLFLPAKDSEAGLPYRIWLFPSRMGGIRFYPKCHWRAELKLGDKSYKMVLFDANADGDYSNDPLAIDVDNDGKASPSELVKPGETIEIDGAPVKLLSIAPSGRWAEFDF